MHSRLNSILKRGSYTTRTEHIIGLSMVQYLDWLSFNFESDMWWSNYGSVWQIDLVMPASAYDLTTEEEKLAAFNWRNIRPCLRADNLAKYNFIFHFHIANQSIRVLAFIRKLRQLDVENNQILI